MSAIVTPRRVRWIDSRRESGTDALDYAVEAARQESDRLNARMRVLKDQAAEAARTVANAQASFEAIQQSSVHMRRKLLVILSRLDELDHIAGLC